jgi:type IV secretory pathway VirB2 component (pilin)
MSKIKTNFLMLTLAVATLVLPGAASASGVGDAVCTVYQCIVNSNLLAIIATMAIFFLGIGAFFGKVNWGLVIMVALGIAVIVGAMGIAATVIDATNGDGAASTCADVDTSAC